MHTLTKKLTAGAVIAGTLAAAGVAGAFAGTLIRGGGHSDALVMCGGGMSRLGQVFSADASVFPGDPAPVIDIVFTAEDDGYLVEQIDTGTHTSTHLDAPAHFIPGARSVDELAAEEFVWPAYIIDVRDRMATDGPDFQLTSADIQAIEADQGRIPDGAMVIIQTGFGELFGTGAYLGDAPGFAGEAVQWMVDNRSIDGVGSDTFGPDATSDDLYDATYTILANDGVALPGLANLDSMNPVGDVIIAPAVALEDGSGFQVDPLACHASDSDDDHHNDDDDDDDDHDGRGGRRGGRR